VRSQSSNKTPSLDPPSRDERARCAVRCAERGVSPETDSRPDTRYPVPHPDRSPAAAAARSQGAQSNTYTTLTVQHIAQSGSFPMLHVRGTPTRCAARWCCPQSVVATVWLYRQGAEPCQPTVAAPTQEPYTCAPPCAHITRVPITQAITLEAPARPGRTGCAREQSSANIPFSLAQPSEHPPLHSSNLAPASPLTGAGPNIKFAGGSARRERALTSQPPTSPTGEPGAQPPLPSRLLGRATRHRRACSRPKREEGGEGV
jgi:hypothetical protein